MPSIADGPGRDESKRGARSIGGQVAAAGEDWNEKIEREGGEREEPRLNDVAAAASRKHFSRGAHPSLHQNSSLRAWITCLSL